MADLIDRAVRYRSRNPLTSRMWAEVAIQKAETAGSPGLSARAWAEKGNAERILEDFAESRASFDVALRLLEKDGGGVLCFRGDVLSLLGSLEHALRRPEEALACFDEALWCYRELEGLQDIWKVKVKKANVFLYQGEFPEALGQARGVVRSILEHSEEAGEDMLLPACHVALLTLVEFALTTEKALERRLAIEVAAQELARLSLLYLSCSAPLWRARHLWLTGRLLLAQEELARAERVLDHTVAEFLDLGLPATAAVASLDLSHVLALRGDLGELRAVAGAACVVLGRNAQELSHPTLRN